MASENSVAILYCESHAGIFHFLLQIFLCVRSRFVFSSPRENLP